MLRNVQHCSFIWLVYCCLFHSPVTCLECGNQKKKKGVHVPCITDPDVDTSTCLSNKIKTIQ